MKDTFLTARFTRFLDRYRQEFPDRESDTLATFQGEFQRMKTDYLDAVDLARRNNVTCPATSEII